MRPASLKLLHNAAKIGVAGAQTSCEPVSASFGNLFAIRKYLELTSLARRENGIDTQLLLDEGHETRDLDLVVFSSRAMNDLDLHSNPRALNVILEAYTVVQWTLKNLRGEGKLTSRAFFHLI